jgi:hypothetical protein
MTAFIILVLLTMVVSVLARVEEAMCEAFSGDWLRFDEEPTERERLELENEEFSWGHNVRNYMEE